jgi:hypothetical protein
LHLNQTEAIYYYGGADVEFAPCEKISSLENPMCYSKIDAGCSLFETNDCFLRDSLAQQHILFARYLEPWKETKSLSDPSFIVADTLELEEDHELVNLVLQNPIQDITYADLFKDGSEKVVACRVFRIQNADALKATISKLKEKSTDDDQIGLFVSEFEYFGQFDHDFVANGHIYIDNSNAQRPLLLWDGQRFLLTKQGEVTGYVEKQTVSCDSVDIEVGGFDLYQSFKNRIIHLNNININTWHNQVNAEWLRQQPKYIVDNTLMYLAEMATELSNQI